MTQVVLGEIVEASPGTVFDGNTDRRGYADLIGPIRTAEEGAPAATASARSGSCTSLAQRARAGERV